MEEQNFEHEIFRSRVAHTLQHTMEGSRDNPITLDAGSSRNNPIIIPDIPPSPSPQLAPRLLAYDFIRILIDDLLGDDGYQSA